VCGRSLCVACATPVRDRLIGTECLPAVLQGIDPVLHVPAPIPRRGDVVAGAGFLAVLLLSILPWSRGDVSAILGAWSGNWSLVAALAALAGSIAAALAWRQQTHPGLAGALYAGLGLTVGVGALLHHVDPPLLAEPSIVPTLAIIGAGVVLAGAIVKGFDVAGARHAPGRRLRSSLVR
jgi:hypothetical protein